MASMTDEIKSGQKVLDEFFSGLTDIEEIDKKIANIVIKLYKEGKLTHTNLSNELMSIREEQISGKD